MRILIDISHPKDVNVFRNVILTLQDNGHEIKITARDKENTKKILEGYGFEYEVGHYHKNLVGKALGIISNDIWLYKISKRFKPNIFISQGSPYSAHVSKMLRKPHVAFIDTEIASLATKLMLPFTDKIFTPSCFYLDLGAKQFKFNSYYELAYLSPKYFVPKKEILKKYGLDQEYIIMRLSNLSSHHDLNSRGFDFKNENELIDYIHQIEKYARVIIFSETNHWQTITDYHMKIDPKDMHDILSFAKLYIGEGASMASEAAILGVPAIYVSNTKRGYLDELEKKYDLVYTITDREKALDKVKYLFQEKYLSEKWKKKKDDMIKDKIDPVEFMIEIIEKNGK